MHLAEGVLPLNHAVAWSALAAPAVVWSLRDEQRTRRERPSSSVIMAGTASLLFAGTLLPLPVPVAGVTSHICLTPVLALIVGVPRIVWPTFFVLLLQAVFFAHGGLTTLGVNILTLGLLGPLAAVGLWALLRRLGVGGAFSLGLACGVGGLSVYVADAVVLAAVGFEANIEMRTRYLGPGWDMAKVRGSRFNTGDAIQAAIDAGAQPFGNWSGAHAVAWDLNAPPTGNRIVADLYQKHSYPYGLIVNLDGERFVDEGADIRNYTYAKYGRAILSQPERAAFQLFDQRTAHLLRDEYHVRQVTMAQADTIEELAESLGVDSGGLQRTIDEYNQSCPEHGIDDFNPSTLDGVGTRGINPPKSNWALPFDSPPYLGYAVTCGITFTFGGLKIDPGSGQVVDTEDRPMTGLYAAGELVGGLFYNNYAGGSGLMAGSVFGRIAGRSAADASR